MSQRNTRKRRRRESRKTPWLTIAFVFTSLWLAVSIFYEKAPMHALIDGYNWIAGRGPTYPNSKELKGQLRSKTMLVDSLNLVIEQLNAQSPYRTAIVTTTQNSLNLRSAPNLTSEIVIKIPDSSAVEVLYFDEEVLVLDGQPGKWCKIKYADKEGWVWGNYLTFEE